jgi:hypothetical protein
MLEKTSCTWVLWMSSLLVPLQADFTFASPPLQLFQRSRTDAHARAVIADWGGEVPGRRG